MPAIHNNKHLDTEWIKNATTLWGIPLHPLGEMAFVDYLLSDSDDITLMQARLASIQFQVFFYYASGLYFCQQSLYLHQNGDSKTVCS
jgi:hypothetical protein